MNAKMITVLKWFGIILTAFISIMLIPFFIKKFKQWSQKREEQKAKQEEKEKLKQEKKSDVVNEYGDTVNISLIAEEIYDSFYNNDYLGFSEDEDRAVNALLKVPDSKIDSLKDFYTLTTKKGRTLGQDFERFVSDNKQLYNKVRLKLHI